MVTKQKPPQPGALERQWHRQRRAHRNRKIGAMALVASVIAALLTIAITLRSDTGPRPATRSFQPGEPVIVGLDGSILRQVAGLPPDVRDIAISPDGTTIAFVSSSTSFDASLGGFCGACSPHMRIFTRAIDGGAARMLEVPGPAGAAELPAWSPDGSKIAFVNQRGHIAVMDADGRHLHPLTTGPTDDAYPSWSPDGSRIAYSSSSLVAGPAFGVSEIDTISVDGGTPTRLTQDTIDDSLPTWSPDGSRIAYVSGRELYVMDADGTNAHTVGEEQQAVSALAWSPDGRRLATLEDIDPSGTEMAVIVRDLETGAETSVGPHVAGPFGGVVWASSNTLLITGSIHRS